MSNITKDMDDKMIDAFSRLFKIYNDFREKWIQIFHSDAGFDHWFTKQLLDNDIFNTGNYTQIKQSLNEEMYPDGTKTKSSRK